MLNCQQNMTDNISLSDPLPSAGSGLLGNSNLYSALFGDKFKLTVNINKQ